MVGKAWVAVSLLTCQGRQHPDRESAGDNVHRHERQGISQRRARDAGDRREEREHEHDGRHHLPGALGTSAAEADDRGEDEHRDEHPQHGRRHYVEGDEWPGAGRRLDEDGLGDQAGGRKDEEQSEVDERRQPGSPIVSKAARGSLESAGWLDLRKVLTEDLSSVGIRPAVPQPGNNQDCR